MVRMDRGRVGYNAIGNKCIRENMIAERRDTHLAKLKKIKNRKPGTSTTVDCTAPKAIEAAKCNPRKKAISQEWSGIIEKENKALLQRISAVLTAPPKVDDGEYLKMRKICASLKSSGGQYEKKLQEKKTKQMFAQIKKIGPYYNPKKWELEYRRQLEGQKFMRQVTYKRPKDFVDPYAPQPEPRFDDDEDSEVRSKNGSLLADKFRMINAQRSYSHISMVRNVRKSHKDKAQQQLSKSAPVLSLVDGNNATSSAEGDEAYDDDDCFDDDGDAEAGIAVIENGAQDSLDGEEESECSEKRVMLADTNRSTKIFDPSYSVDHSFPLDAAIECFLIDNTTALVIAARTMDKVGGAPLVAEAEIDLGELANIKEDLQLFRRLTPPVTPAPPDGMEKGSSAEMNSLFAPGDGNVVDYEYNLEALKSLATDMVNSVEIRVEDTIPRLVLNISFDSVAASQRGSFDHSVEGGVVPALDGTSTPPLSRGRSTSGLASALGRTTPLAARRTRSPEAISSAVRQSERQIDESYKCADVTESREMMLVVSKAIISGAGLRKGSGGNGAARASSKADAETLSLLENQRAAEKIPCRVAVEMVADDKVNITVTALGTTKAQWMYTKPKTVTSPKGHQLSRTSSMDTVEVTASVLNQGDVLNRSIGLPSIMQADQDLIAEYVANIFENLSIEYEEMTGACSLVLR